MPATVDGHAGRAEGVRQPPDKDQVVTGSEREASDHTGDLAVTVGPTGIWYAEPTGDDGVTGRRHVSNQGGVKKGDVERWRRPKT